MSRIAWLVPLALVVLITGVTRLQLDANIFNLLPGESAMVQSLQRYQQDFGSANELILLLRTADAAASKRAAEQLAAGLVESGLANRVIWRNPFQGNPEELGELLAYLWINQPEEQFGAFVRRFDTEVLPVTLERTLERMSVSFQPLEVARLAADPYRIGDISQRVKLPVPSGAGDPFASADGTARIVAVAAPFDAAGFFRIRAWVSEVNEWLVAWQSARDPSIALTVGVTGNPSFVAESGSSLLRDVLAAATGTMMIVALLFWLVHRRWRPLLWLVALLAGVLAGTALAGGALFGPLNAVSLGFAAILLGLAADYGLILYQETVAHPGQHARDYRNAVAPAIIWSAVTTAGAFFMIGRSSLPGLTQLGVLVGIGILFAAIVMLTAYLPLVGLRADESARTMPAPPRMFRLGARTALAVTVLLVATALATLAQRQPTVDSDARSLSPNSGTSRIVLEDIRREIGGFEEDLWLVVTGEDERTVQNRLAAATPLLDQAVAAEVLAGYQVPAELWPQSDEQAANIAALDRLVGRWPDAAAAAKDAGFAADALRLTTAAFSSWQRFLEDAADTSTAWPETPGARWVMRQFAVRQEGRMAALGRLEATPNAQQVDLQNLGAALANADAGQLVSWTLLADELLGVMDRDVDRVLIPMTIALLIILIVAFRSAGEVVLSMASLALSLALLLTLMTLLGWSWNLMNVMALPMLFGAGVDYGLHVQFAMRRYQGDAVMVRNTVGRAILLCAASTAAGFATLGFAANSGLASLGRVCATGIVITSLVSVFLLPAWWRIMPRMNALVSRAE